MILDLNGLQGSIPLRIEDDIFGKIHLWAVGHAPKAYLSLFTNRQIWCQARCKMSCLMPTHKEIKEEIRKDHFNDLSDGYWSSLSHTAISESDVMKWAKPFFSSFFLQKTKVKHKKGCKRKKNTKIKQWNKLSLQSQTKSLTP